MSKQKAQGTRLETALVIAARSFGLHAARIAEGGSYDEGDVEIRDRHGRRHIVECRAREQMSVHVAWTKARVKAGDGDHVALLWKRLVKVPGRQRRVAAGPPLVCLPLHDYLLLLANQETT
jgi:hypothetical protein